MSTAPIGIVGAGLAGLAAAIELAQSGHEVIAWESGQIGRDKVCGEFLSPEAAEDLQNLDCGHFMEAMHPALLQRVHLIAPQGTRLELTLPDRPGFGLSRRMLEAFLAARARAAGASILERTSVRELVPLGKGRLDVRAGGQAHCVSALILGFGKRSTLDAPLRLPRAREKDQTHFGAVKAYFAPQELDADIELYLLNGGYVGVNPIEDGRIGVCGLFATNTGVDIAELRRRAEAHPLLRRRLERLGDPISKPRGLAGFGYGAQAISRVCPESGVPLLFTGDAARAIPSFTGDGMAIALRSGRLAAHALRSENPVSTYNRSFLRTFAPRFTVSNALHTLFFKPNLFQVLAPIVGRYPQIVEGLVRLTRG